MSLRVLHVVRQFAPSIGGLENYVAALATHQQQLGLSCELLTLDRVFGDRTRLAVADTVDGVRVARVPFFGGRRLFMPFGYRKLLADRDIVHVHSTDSFFDILGLLPPKAPLVATTHGGFFHTDFMARAKRTYLKHVTARTCRAYSCLLANSENDLTRFQSIHRRVSLLPNGVEPIGLFIGAGSDILCLGRLASHKRVDRVIRAFAELLQLGVNSRLHVVGPEWDVSCAALEEVSSALGVSSAVVFHGAVSKSRLREIAQQCGFYCSGSDYEGFGMSLIEAMSVGLVPLVHNNASFTELVRDAKVGAAIDFEDTGEVVVRLEALMRRTTSSDRRRAQAFARSFAWPAVTERCVRLYEQAIQLRQSQGCGRTGSWVRPQRVET